MTGNMVYNFNSSEVDLIHAKTCVYDMHYHIVWVTKYRKKVLTPTMQEDVKQWIKQICNQYGFTLEAMEVLENHVHILVTIPPKYSIANAVRWLKGITGRWAFMKYPELKKSLWNGHLWSRSYYCGSIGQTTEAIVRNYIDTQRTRPYK